MQFPIDARQIQPYGEQIVFYIDIFKAQNRNLTGLRIQAKEAEVVMTKRNNSSGALVTALGLAVQGRRKELGLSQEDLAGKAGLHRTYVSEIERRSRNLSVKILVRLAMALGISPSQLMQDAEEIVETNPTKIGVETE
jgi:ribosome-binding protein aMBF1 (putative translation factor)